MEGCSHTVRDAPPYLVDSVRPVGVHAASQLVIPPHQLVLEDVRLLVRGPGDYSVYVTRERWVNVGDGGGSALSNQTIVDVVVGACGKRIFQIV